jgi:Protein of unknown function, DUF547
MRSIPSFIIALMLCMSVVAQQPRIHKMFDHSLLDHVLKEYTKEGYVDYQRLKTEPQLLNKYLNRLAVTGRKEMESFSKKEQMAFWINAYNAITLKTVIDSYPINGRVAYLPADSIEQVPGALNRKKTLVAGRNLTLETIENKLLKDGFKDERLHFAISRAALGAPRLQPFAYSGELLDDQLKIAVRDFINDPYRTFICQSCNRIQMSKIFDWHGEDFQAKWGNSAMLNKRYGTKQGAVLTFIAAHQPQAVNHYILNAKYDIIFIDYNWALNDIKNKKK